MTLQSETFDVQLMRQALALAAQGRGYVEPNPMVGCVIHRDGKILGTGYHQAFGQRHAEPNSLANCAESPAGATAVVTLEPCCHTNKKTPPCVPALIAAGIRRVVVGQIDPNPDVAGRGLEQLRDAGIEIVTGVLEKECRQLNAAFYAHTKLRRPYITLKWAQSADGYIGGPNRTRRRISSPQGDRFVHMLRTRCDAIAVSADTVICDDPSLTVRHVPVVRIPKRIVMDTRLRMPAGSRILVPPPPTIVFTSADASDLNHRVGKDVTIVQVPRSGQHLDLPRVIEELHRLNVTHLLIEPGERLAAALLDSGLWDRIWIVRSPDTIGDATAPRAPQITLTPVATRQIGPDVLDEYLNHSSPAYFAPIMSPDFMLSLD